MRATLGPIVFTLPALLAAAAWSPSHAQTAAPASADPKVAQVCSLMSKAEFEKLTGGKLYSDPEPMSLAGGAGAVCDYGGGEGQIILYSGPSAGALLDGLVKGFGHEKEVRHPAPDVAEGAYMMFIEPQSKYQDPVGVLVMKSGAYAMGVTLAAAKDQPPESVKPNLATMGKAVLAKLN